LRANAGAVRGYKSEGQKEEGRRCYNPRVENKKEWNTNQRGRAWFNWAYTKKKKRIFAVGQWGRETKNHENIGSIRG